MLFSSSNQVDGYRGNAVTGNRYQQTLSVHRLSAIRGLGVREAFCFEVHLSYATQTGFTSKKALQWFNGFSTPITTLVAVSPTTTSGGKQRTWGTRRKEESKGKGAEESKGKTKSREEQIKGTGKERGKEQLDHKEKEKREEMERKGGENKGKRLKNERGHNMK